MRKLATPRPQTPHFTKSMSDFTYEETGASGVFIKDSKQTPLRIKFQK